MFIGKYYHKLEQNGRIVLPKSFRDEQQQWVVTRGLDGSLFLFSEESFDKEMKELEARSFTTKINRDFIRLMANEAQEIAADKSGRVQLPEYLIRFAQLSEEVVIVGSLNRVEIWDRQLYHRYLDQIESHSEEIAEKLVGQKEQ